MIKQFRHSKSIPPKAQRYYEAHEAVSLLAGDLSEANQEIINKEWMNLNQVIDPKSDESLEDFIIRRRDEILHEEEIKARGLSIGSLMESSI